MQQKRGHNVKRQKRFAALLAALLAAGLTACGQTTTSDELENGVSAIEDAMSTSNKTNNSVQSTDDLRAGTSADTVATPDDFPAAYNYGSGKIEDYSRTRMLQKLPAPQGEQTVLNTAVDPTQIQVLYLWEQGNVPAKTNFTTAMTGYFDN